MKKYILVEFYQEHQEQISRLPRSNPKKIRVYQPEQRGTERGTKSAFSQLKCLFRLVYIYIKSNGCMNKTCPHMVE